MSASERRYAAHELREILSRVPRQKGPQEEGLTRSELMEIGREVGVGEEQMGTALARYDTEQQLVAAEAEIQQLSRRGFATHLIAFVWVGALLGVLSIWGGPAVMLPLLLWGMGLTLHLRAALFPHPDQLREAARRRIARQRLRESSRHFGDALAEGASRVLSAAAQHLDSATGRRDDRSPPAGPDKGRDRTKRSL